MTTSIRTMLANPATTAAAALLAALTVIASAEPATAQGTEPVTARGAKPATGGRAEHASANPVLQITATDYAFLAPASVAAGWVRIRFMNEGAEPHFVFISRLPEGRTVDDYEAAVLPTFAGAWRAVRDDGASVEAALGQLQSALPEWYGSVHMVGGPGYLSPGRTSESVIRLEPGSYVLECYMKTADGRIHYMEGMVRPLEVVAGDGIGSPPEADVQVTLTNQGVGLDGAIAPGRVTFAVHAAQNPEVGYGHSAHLARLAPDTEVGDIVSWVNWFAARGMSAPAPVEFVGGVHFMPEGDTAFFAADLEPGRYLLISESTAHAGILREFTVR
jgi:hypothetical protein